MKKYLLPGLIAILFLCSNDSYAKIRRVGYPGTAVVKTDYSTLQSAHDSASVGDTIFLYPGNWSATFAKRLILIGYGYFVSGTGSNANLQYINGAQSTTLYLDSTASNSVIEGVDGINIFANYQHPVNGITLRGINGNIYFNNKTCSNWQVLQCFLNSIYFEWAGGMINNITVNNSYIYIINMTYSGVTGSTGQFNNDVIQSAYYNSAKFLVKNCIVIYGRYNETNVVYQNTIADSDYGAITTLNGNKNINTTTMQGSVFTGFITQGISSNDGRYMLKTGSPAKGAGTGGTDCGMFGGANPYHLSGIPPIPSIYKMSATTTTTSTNPYTITISVRSNN